MSRSPGILQTVRHLNLEKLGLVGFMFFLAKGLLWLVLAHLAHVFI